MKDLIELKKQVIIEANNLLTHTTERERKLLDFDSLDPRNASSCIYGQMTGDCFSKRSYELIQKCALKLIDNQNGADVGYTTNLEFYDNPIVERVSAGRACFSPIEIFIMRYENRCNGNNKMLISFLRGDRKTLNLE